MQTDQAAPYAGLTPDVVLNAVDSVGLLTDGRQLALNSYENRVFQVGLEDGRFVVVKFYRPHRWTDEQIMEEHAFIAELAELEIPGSAGDDLWRTHSERLRRLPFHRLSAQRRARAES